MVTAEPRSEIGVCLLDTGGTIIDLDPGFVELAQLDEPARGRPIHELLAEAPPLPATGSSVALLEREGGVVELTARRCAAGDVAYTLVARRIFGESALAQQLRVARQTLDSVIQASPLAILTVDRNQRVVMWNPAAERIFGWTQAELVGRPYPLVPEDQREGFERLFRQVVLEGSGFTGIESSRLRKDGELVDLRMHTAPLRDAVGRVTGAVALLEDLTEKRQLEERIRHSQKMEAIGRLAGGIAHDFNNLLTVVLGNADLLELDPSLSPYARERVAEILDVTRSARELVAQLMTFSRRQVNRPEVLDLNLRVREATRMLDRLLGDAIELSVEVCDEPTRVRIDPAQLDRVLVNLAVNAADAMPGGGRLSLRTELVELESEGAGGRHVHLAVCDTGVGIPPDVLPHIFEPFFTTKPTGRGSGLGLANVYGIIQQASGDILVESDLPGGGTCFHLYLPTVAEPVARPISGPHLQAVPRGTEAILLVEDDDAVRRSTTKLLGALGYRVEAACNGVEALERWDRLDVDLVLTDLSMPIMGGAELAKRLRERAPDLPIVFMSGNLDVDELREQIEHGRARFLQKPVSLRELAQTTREALDAAGARGA
jgi:two-component system, cell cycle sensor histidine kinase and response regulator CckA